MKTLALLMLVTVFAVIVVRGAFNILISPFISASCEAE